MVDRYTRWPEAVPLRNAQAETVAHAFTSAWIARFGIPSVLTTDQGRQFQSTLWLSLTKCLGILLAPTSAYHPQANGMVERFHRQLKSALAAHAHRSSQWVDSLPFVMLGIRAAVKEDIRYSSAELVYGAPLRLPAIFFSASVSHSDSSALMAHLDTFFKSIRPTPTRQSTQRYWHVPQSVSTASHVFLRVDAHCPPLSPAYEGPLTLTNRTDKTITVIRNGKTETVSIDRVKPAFLGPDTTP
ncbi:integrase core domain protein [Trichuris suis]|nr:integrase core domain protein [Trichuris suis]